MLNPEINEADQEKNKKEKETERHLTPLPYKSFKVAPGDVVGGLIYFCDKPLGIEEGMVGISIDSKAYRQYLLNFIETLDKITESKYVDEDLKPLHEKYLLLRKGKKEFSKLEIGEKNLVIDALLHHPNLTFIDTLPKEQQDELKTLINTDLPQEPLHVVKKISWQKNAKKLFTKKMHEMKTKEYVNKGMGGLLFEHYKKHCDITDPKEHFAKQIQKLITEGNRNTGENATINDVYMIKQDGKLGLFGGTGPGAQKILKTTTGKALQEYFTPKWLLPTLGLSGLYVGAVLGIRRLGYLIQNKTKKTNADALCETLATKMVNARGRPTQDIEILNGSYENKAPKFVTMVTWKVGCRDFSGKLDGSKNEGVVVAQTDKGEAIKKDEVGNLLIKRETKQGTVYIEINEKGKQEPVTKDQKQAYKAIAQRYDNAFSLSERKIDGLGESLIHFICLGDRDGIGKKGQNKAYLPGKGEKEGRMQFFGIDFGKAFQGKNPIVDSLKDDFSFKDPKSSPPKSWFVDEKFYNYSMLCDNPLREKMKGIYMLGALRGTLPDDRKIEIAQEYENLGDSEFANRLRSYPGEAGINADIKLIHKEIEKMENQMREDPKHAKDYQFYIARLKDIETISNDTDTQVLNTFSKRAQLLPSQIDAIEKMEKLCAQKAHIFTPDGKVVLNHIRVKNEDRIPWQFENGKLTCELNNKGVQQKIQGLINSLETQQNRIENQKEPNENLTKLISHLKNQNYTDSKIIIPIDSEMLNTFNTHVTEERIATLQKLTAFQNQEKFLKFEAKRELITEKPQHAHDVSSERVDQLKNISLENERLHQEPKLESEALAPQSFLNMKNLQSSQQNLQNPPEQVVATQHNSKLNDLDNYIKNNRNGHNIKTSQLQNDKLTMTVNLNDNKNFKIFAKSSPQNSSVKYSTNKNIDDEKFRLAAKEICHLAIFSAKDNARVTISPKLPQDRQDILTEEFNNALNEAKNAGKFSAENAPTIIPPVTTSKRTLSL